MKPKALTKSRQPQHLFVLPADLADRGNSRGSQNRHGFPPISFRDTVGSCVTLRDLNELIQTRIAESRGPAVKRRKPILISTRRSELTMVLKRLGRTVLAGLAESRRL
jgi:hypothetical protein